MHERDAEQIAQELEKVAQRVRSEPPVSIEISHFARRGDTPGRFTAEIVWNDGADEAGRIAAAVQTATENPGHMVAVDDPWKGFQLDVDEAQR